ncbi:MAG TPA: SEC-C metal-binding domain-containing protein, partial [Phycisphaerae bacterium]|nr:SEC-C metal-binding domain-containing protein [Phycisphaerae bacterium]
AATGEPNRVNHFCEGYQRFFREALPELRRIGEAIQQGRPPAPAPPPATQAAPAGPVARNAPCPCGSGRKYKQCCGRK